MTALQNAKQSFLQLFASIPCQEDRRHFTEWISTEFGCDSMEDAKLAEKRKLLSNMAQFAKSLQPNFEAIASSETVKPPQNSEENFTNVNTIHIDAFLYDDIDVQEMTENKVTFNYSVETSAKKIFDSRLFRLIFARLADRSQWKSFIK